MRIMICDDVKEDRELLQSYCQRYAALKDMPIEIQVYENAGKLLQYRQHEEIDAMFLDIYMDGASGVDAAHILRNKGYRGDVVFTTTSKEHYADGFALEATHYLIKPVTWESFCEAMRRICKRCREETHSITVTVDRKEIQINVSNITYIEVYGHKTMLHTKHTELSIRESLVSIEAMLQGLDFLRCYRYFIINMAWVARLNKNGFLMKDGREIPISRDTGSEIKRIYLAYLFRKSEVNSDDGT